MIFSTTYLQSLLSPVTDNNETNVKFLSQKTKSKVRYTDDELASFYELLLNHIHERGSASPALMIAELKIKHSTTHKSLLKLFEKGFLHKRTTRINNLQSILYSINYEHPVVKQIVKGSKITFSPALIRKLKNDSEQAFKEKFLLLFRESLLTSVKEVEDKVTSGYDKKLLTRVKIFLSIFFHIEKNLGDPLLSIPNIATDLNIGLDYATRSIRWMRDNGFLITEATNRKLRFLGVVKNVPR